MKASLRSCDGRRARFVLIVGALASAGCASFERSRFEMRVRSPAQVAVEEAGVTIVPEGTELTPRVVLTRPDAEYRAGCAKDGALSLEFPSTWSFGGPTWDTVVDAQGRAEFLSAGRDVVVTGDVVRVPLCHEWSRGGCRSRLDLRTPRDNVTQLDTVAELPRAGALPFGLLGISLVTVGGIEAGIEPGNATRRTIAVSAIGVGAVSLVLAGVFLFLPARRRALAPATPPGSIIDGGPVNRP